MADRNQGRYREEHPVQRDASRSVRAMTLATAGT